MTSVQAKKRLPHIEFLRVMCMFFIVVWHAVIHGAFGVAMVPETPYADTLTGQFNLLLMNILAYMSGVAVDTYVLITGYFLVSARFRWEKVCRVWTQAWFYSALLAGVAWLFCPERLTADTLVNALLPLVPGQDYWFVTAYIGLLVLSPYLSLLAGQLDRRAYRRGLAVLFVLVVSFCKYLPYGRHYYSPLMLFILLFFLAGYVARFRPMLTFRGQELRYGRLYMAGCLLLALGTTVAEVLVYRRTGHFTLFSPANAGFSLPLASLLFMWALRFRLRHRWQRLLVRLAPFTFGIYLMHDGRLMRTLLWNDWVPLRLYWGCPTLVPRLLAVVVVVFVAGACIDALRALLFRCCPLDEWLMSALRRAAVRLRKSFPGNA